MSGPVPTLTPRIIERPGTPTRLLVLLHGYGEPVADLTDRLHLLDPHGHLLAVAPDGPYEHKDKVIWHRALTARDEAELQFTASLTAIDAHLAELEAATGLPAAEAVVGGFSQGGGLALALLMWADAQHRPAAAFGVCSFPPFIRGFRASRSAARGRPAFLSGARRDRFAPIESCRGGAATLADVGMAVTYAEEDSEHVMTDRIAGRVGDWLAAVHAGRRPAPTPDQHLLDETASRTDQFGTLWHLVS